jgi:dihydrolipoamide dehydrogenase
MQTLTADVAILGAGTAGLNARRAAEAAGATAILIDPGPFGTTCARVGCMPSKLLIAAAEAAHHARSGGIFGVHAREVEVNGREVMARVQAERDRFVGFVTEATDEHEAAGRLVVGRGRVLEPGLIQVDDHTLVRYRALVVATGTAPIVPPPYRDPALRDRILTNEQIFELEDLPESVLVVGLGVIGLELGQALHRLGARVSLVGLGDMVGPLTDPAILDEARRVFSDEMDLHTCHELRSVRRVEGGVQAHFVDATGEERDETYEYVLLAAGRRANLAPLNLEAHGLRPDERGQYKVDPQTLQVGDAPVFLAGDVNGLHPLLHEASDDGRLAGRNAARFPLLETPERRAGLTIVFTDPQIAIVGGGLHALEGEDITWGEVDYGRQGRARVMNRHKGRVRIYGRRSDRVLVGAEMLGPDVRRASAPPSRGWPATSPSTSAARPPSSP